MRFTTKIKLAARSTTTVLVLAGNAMRGPVGAQPVSEPNKPGNATISIYRAE